MYSLQLWHVCFRLKIIPNVWQQRMQTFSFNFVCCDNTVAFLFSSSKSSWILLQIVTDKNLENKRSQIPRIYKQGDARCMNIASNIKVHCKKSLTKSLESEKLRKNAPVSKSYFLFYWEIAKFATWKNIPPIWYNIYVIDYIKGSFTFPSTHLRTFQRFLRATFKSFKDQKHPWYHMVNLLPYSNFFHFLWCFWLYAHKKNK